MDVLEENSNEYGKSVLKFILYYETGIWEEKGKPDGKWLRKKMQEAFEKPVLDYINKK